MKTVSSTDALNPSIIACAIGAYCSEPVPILSAIGIIPMMVAKTPYSPT